MEKFESVIDRMSFIEMDKLSKELQKKVAERWTDPEGLLEVIKTNIDELKKRWSGLDSRLMCDWWRFCEELNCLCVDTGRTWRLIEKYNIHNKAAEERLELKRIQDLFDTTLKFYKITVAGRDYKVSDGKVVFVDNDSFPVE